MRSKRSIRNQIYSVGERVEIKAVVSGLKHRRARGKVYGFIARINSECHYIRPAWCTWEVELYRNEIRKVA